MRRLAVTALVVLLVVLVLVVVAIAVVARRLEPEAMRVELERQATAALGQPVAIASVDLELSLRPRIVLKDVRIGAPVVATIRRVAFETGRRALLSRRIEGAALAVDGSRVPLPLPLLARSADAADGAASPATPPPQAVSIVSVDRITLREIDLVVGDRVLRLDLTSSLAGDRLVVTSLRLASAHTTIDGRGELESIDERRGTFTLTADTLDMDELLAIASGISAAPAETEALQPRLHRADPGIDDRRGRHAPQPHARGADVARDTPMDLRLEVTTPRGRVLGIPFSSLAASIALAPNAVTIDPLKVQLLGGGVSGTARVTTDVSPATITLVADLAALDVAALAAQAGVDGVMTGRLGGHVDLRAQAGPQEVVYRTATGEARLVVRDGTIPGLDLVGPVVRVSGGRSGGAPAAAGSSHFSTLQGTFALDDGVLRTSDLQLRSDDVDLQGRGSLRLPGATVDLAVDLMLSEALSAQAGRDLFRYAREGARVVLPATVRGPLASPTVFVDVKAAAGRALRNTVDEELDKALGRLFKR